MTLDIGDGDGVDLDISIDFESFNVGWRSAMSESGESLSVGEDLEAVDFVDNGQVEAEMIHY